MYDGKTELIRIWMFFNLGLKDMALVLSWNHHCFKNQVEMQLCLIMQLKFVLRKGNPMLLSSIHSHREETPTTFLWML